MTEMLKDERGGGEIIQIEGAGYTKEQRYRGEHRADEFKSSSSRTSYIPPALFIPSLPPSLLKANQPRNTMKTTLQENV